ncbi:Carbon-nitrogen hydrolase [Mortierella polycephala]|uniref:Carbon-nitrogen hydrolase n=1 Tax=Mortierella polycephala TaxID=41804 RepID=A0A9P6UAF6_9FUNG|nr:Carbon-nitrogen hydrolase [Mortierella polycephala]
MKIVCLQIEPVLGEVQRNIDHATEMISKLMPNDVDVLVLPEMAFTGYVFASKDHIRPYLEDAETGVSVQWAKMQAMRLNAHVQVGYPERRVVNTQDQAQEKFYNSVCFVSPEGKVLATYAKHFLYYTDEVWAEGGPAFQSIPVKGLGQVGFGICMDVNPYQFKAPFTDFEFSNFHRAQKTDLLLCSMAWNKGEEAPKKENVESKRKPAKSKARPDQAVGESQSDTIGDEGEDDDDWTDEDNEEDQEREAMEMQYDTVQYWAVRMNPFYKQNQRPSGDAFIVIANRIGTESGNLFVGSSCVLRLSQEGPELVGVLPANKEGILQVEIDA